MKLFKTVTLSIVLAMSLQATNYENAEDQSTLRWSIYDNSPEGAVINNIFDDEKNSRVIELTGNGKENGFVLLNEDGSQWENQEEFTVKWDTKTENDFSIYIEVMTSEGAKYAIYTSNTFEENYKNNDPYIEFSLGNIIKNGTWQTLRKNFFIDLKEALPDINITSVMNFSVRGSGKFDNISLLTPKMSFLDKLYQDIFNRAPDEGGSEFWMGEINNDSSPTTISKSFFNSQEFTDLNLDNEGYINRLYNIMLNREADLEGLNYWLAKINDIGMMKDQLFYEFAMSNEFNGLCENLYEMNSTNQNDLLISFTERFYNILFKRSAEYEGVEYWTNALKDKTKSAREIAKFFFFSEEFETHNYANEEIIKLAYRTLMGREADVDGINFWLNQMNDGLSKESLIDQFINSPEFINLAEKYGLKTTNSEFSLISSDIENNGLMKSEQVFTGCGGQNISPEIIWENAPQNTKSFAVTMFDPDANSGEGFWHWLVFNIPSNVTKIDKNAGINNSQTLPQGSIQSITDFGTHSYNGACPSAGETHKYQFTIYALDVLELPFEGDVKHTKNSNPADIKNSLEAHTISTSKIEVNYSK